MRWRFTAFLSLVLLVVVSWSLPRPALGRIHAAIVVDHATGAVLYARRADRPVYPASLTKLMTLYLTFEALREGRLRLDQRLPVSRRAARQPPSRLGLRPGERIRLRDAILALTVKSANDVAVVLAEALAGSERAFARRMTARARALGMRNTRFRNASGLPHRAQKTTARDMALLARRLLEDFPEYYRFFGKRSFRFRGRVYRNHNRLLGRYAGVDGLKTGYIRASGYNLVASARRDGRRVIAVVIGGRTARARDREMRRLLDLGFRRARLLAVAARVAPRPAATTLAAASAPRPPAMPVPAARALAMGGDGPSATAGLPAAVPRPRPVAALLTPRPRPPRAQGQGAGVRAVAGTSPPRQRAGRALRVAGARPGPYGVQVGAFLRPDQAYEAARRAMRLAPELLLTGDIAVSPRTGRRRVFYRARVVGFDRRTAEAACRLLESQRNDCLVVRLEPPVSVAQR